jgi:hypothetical protein
MVADNACALGDLLANLDHCASQAFSLIGYLNCLMPSFEDREPLAMVPLLLLLRFLLAFLDRSFGSSIVQLASVIVLTSSCLFRLVHELANLRV